MPRSASAPPASERPAVILLPGILGSHLAVDGKRIWLSARILGGLGRLAYPDAGGRVTPDGAIGSVYDDLVAFLTATHEVIEFSFDWRRPIEEEASRLAEVMDQALTARAGSGQPVRLLAHSMGGVVARTVQLERLDVWRRWLERPGSRLLMLGTPNGGSFAPMQVLSGDDTMGNALPFQDHKARRLMAAMPGFLQLQAGLLDPALGLAQSERWQALAEQDMKTLEDANFWHDPGSQRAIYRWGVPAQDVLDRAVDLRRRLDQQRDNALPGFRDRVVMVLGQARFTPAGFEMDAREGLIYLDQPEGGDGRVTQDNALLPGVRAWRVDCPHGDLPDAQAAFPAYLELLQHGDTQRLPLVGAEPGLRSGGAAAMALVRSRPSRQRSAVVVPPTGLGELLAPTTEPSTVTEQAQGALHISVHNTNLKFISKPLMVGHYFASTLSGTEAVVDHFIGGAMSASLAAGLYPESPGTHQIFINNRQDPDSPLAATPCGGGRAGFGGQTQERIDHPDRSAGDTGLGTTGGRSSRRWSLPFRAGGHAGGQRRHRYQRKHLGAGTGTRCARGQRKAWRGRLAAGESPAHRGALPGSGHRRLERPDAAVRCRTRPLRAHPQDPLWCGCAAPAAGQRLPRHRLRFHQRRDRNRRQW